MQIYKDWLNSHGVQFRELPFGIAFQYQGGGFLIANNEDDKLYLQLIMPNIYEAPLSKREKVMTVTNNLNREIKCLKATLQEDGQVWLATETFIDRTPDIDDFFDRLLQILLTASIKFQIMMQ